MNRYLIFVLVSLLVLLKQSELKILIEKFLVYFNIAYIFYYTKHISINFFSLSWYSKFI